MILASFVGPITGSVQYGAWKSFPRSEAPAELRPVPRQNSIAAALSALVRPRPPRLRPARVPGCCGTKAREVIQLP